MQDFSQTNRTAANVNRRIRRHIAQAGYGKKQIDAGLAYARSLGEYDAHEGYVRAMSRILYDDAQLAEGERFSVESGFGPR